MSRPAIALPLPCALRGCKTIASDSSVRHALGRDGAIDTRPLFIATIDEILCTDCLLCLDYCPNDSLAEE